MDAITYLKEKKRYCDNHNCSECDFCGTGYNLDYCRLATTVENESEQAENFVAIIENWSLENKEGE